MPSGETRQGQPMRTLVLTSPLIQRARAALPSLMGVLFVSFLVTARGPDDPTEVFGDSPCDIPSNLFVNGGPAPDGIPALTLPTMIAASAEDYLDDDDRVLGVFMNGDARAYPHRIMWHHEIVNDRIGGRWVTVSFCPLTGSGIAMDATVGGNRVEFAVSGLLFSNNLTMFDRITDELYGPQLSIEGQCERFRGVSPDLVAVREMSWGRWKQLYPETTVVSSNTGFNRPYFSYPYGSYDQLFDNSILFPQFGVDRSRPIKERILAIRTSENGGRGYPFDDLRDIGGRLALNDNVDGSPVTIFYEVLFGEAAVAYNPVVTGQTLTFEVVSTQIKDTQTGTTWSFGGAGLEGPLAGEQLEPLANAYVLMWFAWKHFQPDGEVFQL